MDVSFDHLFRFSILEFNFGFWLSMQRWQQFEVLL